MINNTIAGETVRHAIGKGLRNNIDYEWYAEIFDGQKTTRGKLSVFTVK